MLCFDGSSFLTFDLFCTITLPFPQPDSTDPSMALLYTGVTAQEDVECSSVYEANEFNSERMVCGK